MGITLYLEIQQRDWLLIAFGSYMEPIQIQKTLFKFAKEAGVPESEQYDFVPYNWGPCSTEIYSDLEYLRGEGLVEFVPTGKGWDAYRLTSSGEEAAEQLRMQADPACPERLDEIRDWVKSRSFNRLLKDVYAKYPEYALRSLYQG